ncbi:hypothetical protein JR314_33255 [Pseudomonas aeruginosa]|uniref:hypothetical protein n=1 Tax=Pseudomonas aeruginosa TaxID=287 RepID=UPI00071B8255|nr:hypothetical protein [Pseudomonas aeruginosa]ELV1374853.1 hypothetical protein [Pseudomonas aeruginosa]KSH19863.1 hypothetical protein AO963_22595 [Pseudomonas aeruginosa]MDA3374785.1 hypothetical protein [Pseudomonas aeruginosa]MDI2524296.1 putative molybdenum carrier protein [Pseudomonas aeruginosa]MDY1535356.1 hypothetical protein [Pseudomonas aeruginosa]
MKGPVATVELWEKGRCVFSHAVSRDLLQAAVDEGCHLLLVGGDGAPVLGKDAMVPLGNLLKRQRSQRGQQPAVQPNTEDRSPGVSLGWLIALFEWACQNSPLAEIRYVHHAEFTLPTPKQPLLRIEQHDSGRYAPRTWENAKSADITVAFASDFTTRGEQLTLRAAGEAYVAIPVSIEPVAAARRLYKAMSAAKARTLNVAGNGIYTLSKHGWTQESINAWVYQVIGKVHQHWPIEFIRSGGQTGADVAGLVSAHALGIDCLGLFPKHFLQRAEDNVDVRRTATELEAEIRTWALMLGVKNPTTDE